MSKDKLDRLTDKELECLRIAATGASGKIIAKQMQITERTVRFHLTNIRKKLEVERTVQAIALYSSNIS